VLELATMVEKKGNVEMVQEPSSEWSLAARLPIAFTDLTGSEVPRPYSIQENVGVYYKLAKTPFQTFEVTSAGQKDKEYLMVGPMLTANDLISVLYFAAPDKQYGLDAEDLIEDWTDLYDKNDPEQVKRRIAHSVMPGWRQFEQSRERVLGFLERNYDWDNTIFDQIQPNDVIVPVLRWKITPDGKRQIILDPLEEGLHDEIVGTLPPQVRDMGQLDSGMGLAFLAAYSPTNTEWKIKDNYVPGSSTRPQSIGPTQVLAYAFRKVAEQQATPTDFPANQDIQASPLLAGMDTYIATGEVQWL
jgi:hypothetical protein